MKRSVKLAVKLAITGSALLVSACGSAPSATPPGVVGPTAVNTNLSGMYPGGCVPVTQPIGFTATNAYFDANTVLAGNIPQVYDSPDPIKATGMYSPYGPIGVPNGTVGISPGGAGGLYHTDNTPLAMTDGQVSMNITSMGAPTQINIPATMTGSITISQAKQQAILSSFGLNANYSNYYPSYGNSFGYNGVPGMPQPGMPNQQVCVTSVAVSLTHNMYDLYGGRVYLFLNNQQHGIYLRW